ncbi:MAG TPA: LysM domain-containing protein [Trebonia sp.]|nr:LysM domain-containing protein [Trebonia sp.]
MSEAAPERAPSRAPSSGGGGGNVFTHKLGPLPTWLWIVIVGLALVAWSWWKNKSADAASSANTASSSTPADQVPQFVNQTFTTVTPPSVNVTAPAGPAGPAGPTGPQSPVPPPTAPVPVKTTAPRPVAPTAQPPIFNKTYIVKKGETLNSIAKQLGISRVDLAHANGLGTGAGLRTGQTLKVPSPAPGGTPNKAQLWRLRR